jgi:hypothetical protein
VKQIQILLADEIPTLKKGAWFKILTRQVQVLTIRHTAALFWSSFLSPLKHLKNRREDYET